MKTLDLSNLLDKRTEIIKAEIGALLYNLGKTHVGFWKESRDKAIKYFDVDEKCFEKEYGYEVFTGYKNYYIYKGNKMPFETDLDSIDMGLKDFIYNEKINFDFLEEDDKLTDIIYADASKKRKKLVDVFFKGCENTNSGIDKGAPPDKQQLKNLWISNAFGSFKEKIGINNLDKRRICFFEKLWDKLKSLDNNLDNLTYKDWLELRRFVLTEIKEWYSHLLSDTRFPINDITLWDQAYMSATLFKASIAAMCLDKEITKEYKTPRSIKWSILGVQYDKLSLVDKALKTHFISWYRENINKCDDEIKKILEEKYALGNEIYRDETGIYFLVPENIYGAKDDSKIYRLNDNLDVIKYDIADAFANIFNEEIYPSIFITESSRGTTNLVYLLQKSKDDFLKPCLPKNFNNNILYKHSNEVNEKNRGIESYNGLCNICGLRPGKKEDDMILCNVCNDRKELRMEDWFENIEDETIWTGDLQDKNGRIALVTIKFEFEDWLNGDFLNTIFNLDFGLDDMLGKVKKSLKCNDKIPNDLVGKELKSINIKDYAETALLERSIGDTWEDLINKKINVAETKIDFKNRIISWGKFSDSDYGFLSKILLQFLVRKNPSPARLRRISESTLEFLNNIKKDLPSFMFNNDDEKGEWRNKRIVWRISNGKKGEYKYNGLEFICDGNDNVYLISSIEQAINLIKKDNLKEKEIYGKIKSDDIDWIKDKIENIKSVGSNGLKITLENASYKKYLPYISIIDPTPTLWQFIVPAECVPELIKEVDKRYKSEFKYVIGKLPMHIGIIFQDYMKPLYIGLKALKNIKRDLENYDDIKMQINAENLKTLQNEGFSNINEYERAENLENMYSLYEVCNNQGKYKFYISPDKDDEWIDTTADKKSDTEFIIYSNTFDFEFMDVNTRRNDIYYKRSKREGNKDNRPYILDKWEVFEKFYDYFKNEQRKTKLQNLISLLYSKLKDWGHTGDGSDDWQNVDDGLKQFMLSSFANVLNLKDPELKENFAAIFEMKSWNELENSSLDDFNEILKMIIDMFEFWHKALKKL